MKWRTGWTCLMLMVCLFARSVCADDEGITVTATGEASVKPNRLEIDLKSSGRGELTSDAVVKYRDALRRTKEAVAGLKVENVKLEERGLSVGTAGLPGQEDGFNPEAAQAGAAKADVNISKSLRLVVSGIDKLSEDEVTSLVARLLDVAKDSGSMSGPDASRSTIARIYGQAMGNSSVTFVVDDASAANKQASEQAFQKAAEKARNLASLAKVELGPVQEIQETAGASGNDESVQQRIVSMMIGGAAKAEDTRITSTTLAEIPVRVNLKVRFALRNGGESK